MENECVHTEQTEEMTLRELSRIIACETGGFTTALPEEDDVDLAKEFLQQIKERYD